MQEFLINDTVNCNLMSLTGYRTLVILGLLMESPKSIDEINEHFQNHKYIKERFSNDTLRIYINSLRAIGCEITRANKANAQKYELISHPFKYNIPKSQLKSLAKLYKSTYDKVDVVDVIYLDNFFRNLSKYIDNVETKDFLKGLSALNGVDKNILEDLIIHCKKKNQITILYNSPKSGPKEIDIVADKLSFKSDKIYFWGNNLTHGEYSYFSVEKILKICTISIKKEKIDFPQIKVGYELYTNLDEYIPEKDEKIIERADKKLIIEINSKNEFNVMQRLLYKASDCKVIYPEEFKLKFINKLKSMDEMYEKI